jgi:hypothetical protein
MLPAASDAKLTSNSRIQPLGHSRVLTGQIAEHDRLALLLGLLFVAATVLFTTGDDAVRGGLHRHLSDPPPRPAVVRLLDVSLSGSHG